MHILIFYPKVWVKYRNQLADSSASRAMRGRKSDLHPFVVVHSPRYFVVFPRVVGLLLPLVVSTFRFLRSLVTTTNGFLVSRQILNVCVSWYIEKV